LWFIDVSPTDGTTVQARFKGGGLRLAIGALRVSTTAGYESATNRLQHRSPLRTLLIAWSAAQKTPF
jgi:hypothetical protein